MYHIQVLYILVSLAALLLVWIIATKNLCTYQAPATLSRAPLNILTLTNTNMSRVSTLMSTRKDLHEVGVLSDIRNHQI